VGRFGEHAVQVLTSETQLLQNVLVQGAMMSFVEFVESSPRPVGMLEARRQLPL